MMEVDAYSMADPVDVIFRYDESWVDKVLAIAKWSEKKDELDNAITELSTPKIVGREHYHLITMIKKLLADSNIAIMMCGMRMCKCLASGLRKAFSQGAKILVPLIMSKLRDKKTQVTDEAHKSLKALFYSMTLEEMLESIKEGMTDKAPNMRVQVLTFLQNSITKKDAKAMKSLLDMLVKLASDGTLEVREKVVELVAELKNVYGMGFLGDKFKHVQSQKLQKILADRTEIAQENSETTFMPAKTNSVELPKQPKPANNRIEPIDERSM
jgi:hypothetical protein